MRQTLYSIFIVSIVFCSRGTKEKEIIYIKNESGEVTGVSQVVQNADGGNINLGGEASLIVSPGTLQSESLIISLNRREKMPPQGDIVPVGRAYEFGPHDTEFLEGNQVRFCYSADALANAGLQEKTVQIYYLDPDSNEYQSIGGSVNLQTHCVTAQIEHFSIYLPAAFNLANVVGNNPPAVTGTAVVPNQAIANLPLRLRVIVTDFDTNHNQGAIASAVVRYRMTGEATGATFPHALPLIADSADVTGQRYYIVFPANHVTPAGLQYRVEVMDNLGATRQLPNNTPTSFVSRAVPHTLDPVTPLRFNNTALTIAAGFSRDFTLQALDETGTWRNIEADSFNSNLGETNRVVPLRIRFTATTVGNGVLTAHSGAFSVPIPIDVRAGQLTKIRILDGTYGLPMTWVDFSGVMVHSTLNLSPGATFDFDAIGYDAYENTALIIPTISAAGGIGTIDNNGLFTAGAVTMPTSGTVSISFAGFTDFVNVNIANVPTILATVPGDGSTGIPVNRTFSIRFSEPMDTSSLYAITQNSPWLPGCVGTVQLSADDFVTCVPMLGNTATQYLVTTGNNTIASFRPAAPLLPGTSYKVRVQQYARSIYGIPLATTPYTSTTGFRTSAGSVSWSPTVNMSTPRAFHRATLLADGRVLLTSTNENLAPITARRSAELFDPAGSAGAGNFTPTANLLALRYGHSATLLADGRVFIFGYDQSGGNVSAEFFNPAGNSGSGNFTPGPPVPTPRSQHEAIRLLDGRVLILCGSGLNSPSNPTLLSTLEIFNPAGAGSFTIVPGNLSEAKRVCLATLLPDGRVLIASGNTANASATGSADIFDPSGNSGAGSISPVGNMIIPRINGAAGLLPNGRILITGGLGGTTGIVSESEIFDPVSGSFSLTDPTIVRRYSHTSSTLADGRILLVGGGSSPLPGAEIYDLANNFNAGGFTNTSPTLNLRSGQTATVLQDGRVLVTGGLMMSSNTVLNTAELFSP